MKLIVKNLKGSCFTIEVKPDDTIADVKKNIETVQGSGVYPAEQQMLIHQGKVLKDTTTVEENNVAENSYVVIMLRKIKSSVGEASSTQATPLNTAQHPTSTGQSTQTVTSPPSTASVVAIPQSAPESASTLPNPASSVSVPDVYDQAVSNHVAGSTLESTIQEILEIGGGNWDREAVMRALRAAYNNPERAVDYLYSGIPEQVGVDDIAQASPTPGGQTLNPSPLASQQTIPSSGPNANPLDLFPQGLPNLNSNATAGNLDFLRNNPEFQALRTMVQENPQMLQHMLQELGMQNPQIVQGIQENQADFLRLINEPVDGEGDTLDQLAGEIPQVTVTPEEREAIQRLEALGFDETLVLEVFFACNRDEELTANYLLDHMHEFDM
ncbi:hypothetical protein DM860_004872 [Cuscuta australis]|uniref:Ubiquitin receptor RAD23 n=1 Tax=Cuscuta australis TaxID=267555 RepID=A0A328DRJ0_9ASTE|nr:hypothetical protein DM860_004872 [Cuscuta australis]